MLMAEMVEKIESVLQMIEKFEHSRPGSIAFTKLEEGIMWLNVMTHHIPLKTEVSENKEENVAAA